MTANTATATLTNVGTVELREPYRDYVEHFYAMLSMSKGQNLKGAICSYNGTLILTFTSCLNDNAIQKRFFQTITAEGVEVAVETNEYEEDEETDPLKKGSDEEKEALSQDEDQGATV